MTRLTILFLMGLSFFSDRRSNSEIISVKTDIIGRECPDTRTSKNNFTNYLSVITLTNTQDTDVHFEIMSCAWDDSFITNSDSINVTFIECDSNFPTSLVIKPHKTARFYARISSNSISQKGPKPPTFKIGFVDIPYWKGFWKREDLLNLEKKRKYKTFWSDDVILEGKLFDFEVEQ